MAPYGVGVPRVPQGPPKPTAWAGNWSGVLVGMPCGSPVSGTTRSEHLGTYLYPPRRSYGTPADNVRDMGVATGAHIQGVGRSLERGWTSSMAELAKKPHFLIH